MVLDRFQDSGKTGSGKTFFPPFLLPFLLSFAAFFGPAFLALFLSTQHKRRAILSMQYKKSLLPFFGVGWGGCVCISLS